MGTKKEILKLRGQLKQLEELERASDEKELKKAAAKALDRDLSDLGAAEIINEELNPGRISTKKTDEIESDLISEFDPFGPSWEEDILAAQREKQRVGYMHEGEELELSDDVQLAKTVKVQKDEMSGFGPFGQ